MKKLLTLFTLLAMFAFASCEENGGDDVNPNDKTEQPEDGNGDTEKPDDNNGDTEIPDDAYIALNKEVVTFSPDGESVDIKVYSNYTWELTNNCDWVTTSITSGEASDEGVTVTLSADLSYDNREGTIIFSCGKAKKPLVVSQSFKEAIIADENSVFNVSAEGGNVIIAYQTTVECEVVIPSNAQSWLSLTPTTRGLVSGSATLTVAENTTYSERSAVIKVVKVGDNTLFAEYTINQVQNDAIIAENNTFELSGIEQSINIAYWTNVECEVVIPEESQSWISLAPATRALVKESATLNIAENNTGAERCAVVKVVATNNNELLAEYTITQNQRYFMEYTSKDGYTITPYNSWAFDATIIRNEYIDGKGYIDFDAPITSIGGLAFISCSSLVSVTIPDGVTSIGEAAFSHCSSLASVTIGNSVTEIGEGAFGGCTSLESVTIPDSVTSIGDSAFYNCESLESVTIPDSVTSIGDYAFDYCTSLESITIPDSVTSIGNSAFYECSSLASVTIPDSVTSIGDSAFYNCESLVSVTIGNSVTEIGMEAFYGCSSLASVTIGNGVTSIGSVAFYECSSLASVIIPDSVTSIGEFAFYRCSSLAEVYCKPTIPPTGSRSIFNYNASGRKIYVPTESVEAYKSASGWGWYADDIVGYDF